MDQVRGLFFFLLALGRVLHGRLAVIIIFTAVIMMIIILGSDGGGGCSGLCLAIGVRVRVVPVSFSPLALGAAREGRAPRRGHNGNWKAHCRFTCRRVSIGLAVDGTCTMMMMMMMMMTMLRGKRDEYKMGLQRLIT